MAIATMDKVANSRESRTKRKCVLTGRTLMRGQNFKALAPLSDRQRLRAGGAEPPCQKDLGDEDR